MIVEMTAKFASGDLSLVVAYIGLGPGLASIGALLVVGGAIITMLVGLVWYPVKQVLRRMRTRRANETPVDEPQPPTG